MSTVSVQADRTAALAICAVIFYQMSTQWSHVGQMVLIRATLLVIEAARLMIGTWAFGVSIDFLAASAFSTSSFVGTTISIVPAGLGLREALVALLSPLVGLDPAIGFLAAAVNRLAGMLGLTLAAVGIYLWMSKSCPERNP